MRAALPDDVRYREAAGQRPDPLVPFSVAEGGPPVHSERAGSSIELIHEPGAREIPVDQRPDEAEALPARVEVALRAQDAVGGPRLHHLGGETPGGHQVGLGPAGEGVQHPHVPGPRDLAGDLGRGVDAHAIRHADVVGGAGRALGRAPDAAGIEEVRAGEVEIHVVRGAAPTEAERVRALDEERPLLVEERFDVREIHHRRIHFHLAEVRVEGRVEGQVGTEAELEVGSERPLCCDARH